MKWVKIKISNPSTSVRLTSVRLILACFGLGCGIAFVFWRAQINDVLHEVGNLRGRQVNRYFCEEYAVMKEVMTPVFDLIRSQPQDKDFQIEIAQQLTPRLDQAVLNFSNHWNEFSAFLKDENRRILEFKTNGSFENFEVQLGLAATCQLPYPWISRLEQLQPMRRPEASLWGELAIQWRGLLLQVAKTLPQIKKQISEDESTVCKSAEQVIQTIHVRDYMAQRSRKPKNSEVMTSKRDSLRMNNILRNQEKTLRENVAKFSMKWGKERMRASCPAILLAGENVD